MYIYILKYIYKYTYTNRLLLTCLSIYRSICLSIYLSKHKYAYINTHTYVHIHMYKERVGDLEIAPPAASAPNPSAPTPPSVSPNSFRFGGTLHPHQSDRVAA